MLQMISKKQTLLDDHFRSDLQCGWSDFKGSVPAGLIIELGVGQGASFDRMCDTFKTRLCYGFDWFHGLPEDWESSTPKGTFSTKGVVPFSPPNGCYVIGMVQDTLPAFLKVAGKPVAFVHFDMDIYSSTKTALAALTPYLQKRTVFLFDEIVGQEKSVMHEQKAFREWVEKTDWQIENVGRLHSFAQAFRLK